MLANKTKVLLVLPQDVLDGAWALAGTATTTFKLPVSGQIVLRALIEEGLKRDDQNLFANIEGQAQAVRRIRSLAGRVGRGGRMELGDRAEGEPERGTEAREMRIEHTGGQKRVGESPGRWYPELC